MCFVFCGNSTMYVRMRIFEPIYSAVCKYIYIYIHFGWHCLCGFNLHWRQKSVSVAVPVISVCFSCCSGVCASASVILPLLLTVVRWRFCYTQYLLLYCVLDDSRHYIGEVFSVLCYRLGNLLQLFFNKII